MLSNAQQSEDAGVELVSRADGFAGMTMFSNPGALDYFLGKDVPADSVMGVTMFALADEEEEAEDDTRAAGWGGLEADSTCGMLMLSRAEPGTEWAALEADSCAGVSLFSAERGGEGMEGKRLVATESLGGMTLFAIERELSSQDTVSDETSVSGPSDACAWDATADTTAGMTLLSWEACSESLCTSDVTALISSVASGVAGLTLFSRACDAV
ncbi:hypothetical protein T484DRAFT_1940753 [Baffinella frigidus]|nr:hypothetical protein T484DRAFT_1940753 [Cryptophyta sp. CCMP2293]